MNSPKIIILLLVILPLALVGCTTTVIDAEQTLIPITKIAAQSTSTHATTSTPPLVTKTPQTNMPEPALPRATASQMPTITPIPIEEQPILCDMSQTPHINSIDGEGMGGALGLIVRLNSVEEDSSDAAYTSLLGGMPLQEQIFQSPRKDVREIGFSPD